MLIPGRSFTGNDYKYGFQGQEKDDEIKGEGNSLNYTFRMHDPRVGRFFARDPLESKFPYLSPYQFSSNTPIMAVELEGLESSKDPNPKPGEGTKSGYMEKKTADGKLTGIPETFQLAEVTVTAVRKSDVVKESLVAFGNFANDFIGEVSGAKHLNYDIYYKGLAKYQNLNKPSKVDAVIYSPFLLLGGAYFGAQSGIVTGYEAYSSWYATTSLSASISANGYYSTFLAVFAVNSGRNALVNGTTNLTGQLMSNNWKFDENINYSQPFFSATFANPFISNFGESFFNLKYSKGKLRGSLNVFNADYFSTYFSNMIGTKMGNGLDTFSGKNNFPVGKNGETVFDIFMGTNTEAAENMIGSGINDTLNGKK